MNVVIHTLEGAAQLVELTYSRNRNSRPSAMFRKLRRMREWQMFGDYPLLATLFYKCVEPNELPDEAAVRKVAEETGLLVELVGQRGLEIDSPRQLIRPEGIQVESIAPSHEHIDLIYFARPVGGAICASPECEDAGWYELTALAQLGANDEIQRWSRLAVETVAARLRAG
jgi:ADP-ribose pyrophosphatase YjhB (NUDIX family)